MYSLRTTLRRGSWWRGGGEGWRRKKEGGGRGEGEGCGSRARRGMRISRKRMKSWKIRREGWEDEWKRGEGRRGECCREGRSMLLHSTSVFPTVQITAPMFLQANHMLSCYFWNSLHCQWYHTLKANSLLWNVGITMAMPWQHHKNHFQCTVWITASVAKFTSGIQVLIYTLVEWVVGHTLCGYRVYSVGTALYTEQETKTLAEETAKCLNQIYDQSQVNPTNSKCCGYTYINT